MIHLIQTGLLQLGLEHTDTDGDKKLSKGDIVGYEGCDYAVSDINFNNLNDLNIFFQQFSDRKNEFWVTNHNGEFQVHRYYSTAPLLSKTALIKHDMVVFSNHGSSFHPLQTIQPGFVDKTLTRSCGTPEEYDCDAMTHAIENIDDLRIHCELSASWYSGWEISLHNSWDVWSIREANYKRYMEAYNWFFGMCECPIEETNDHDH